MTDVKKCPLKTSFILRDRIERHGTDNFFLIEGRADRTAKGW